MQDYEKVIVYGSIGSVFLMVLIASITGNIRLHQNLGGAQDNHILPPQGYGTINPDITQANISQNICKKGWSTSSIRPSSSYTTKLKIQQLKVMGYMDQNPSDYEEDHLISLELGGSPDDPMNLWPEPYTDLVKGENFGAKTKDKVENYLHAEVCNGDMTLEAAQKAIASDWTKVYEQMGNDKDDN